MSTFISTPFDWVGQGLLVVLAIGFALSAAAGVALLVRLPGSGLRGHRRSNPWAETRDLKDKLNRACHVEALFDRYHRLLGGSMVAGAIFVLGSWLHAYDRMQVMNALAPRLPAMGGIVTWLESVAVVIHLLVLLLGALIVVRPQAIKDLLITGLAGRPPSHGYRPGGFAAMLAQEHHALEQQLVLYPRLLGLVVLCGGAYAALALYPALLSVLRVV